MHGCVDQFISLPFVAVKVLCNSCCPKVRFHVLSHTHTRTHLTQHTHKRERARSHLHMNSSILNVHTIYTHTQTHTHLTRERALSYINHSSCILSVHTCIHTQTHTTHASLCLTVITGANYVDGDQKQVTPFMLAARVNAVENLKVCVGSVCVCVYVLCFISFCLFVCSRVCTCMSVRVCCISSFCCRGNRHPHTNKHTHTHTQTLICSYCWRRRKRIKAMMTKKKKKSLYYHNRCANGMRCLVVLCALYTACYCVIIRRRSLHCLQHTYSTHAYDIHTHTHIYTYTHVSEHIHKHTHTRIYIYIYLRTQTKRIHTVWTLSDIHHFTTLPRRVHSTLLS